MTEAQIAGVAKYSQNLANLLVAEQKLVPAQKTSPGEWKRWWAVCLVGMFVFAILVFFMRGRWSPRAARRDLAEHERMVTEELAKLVQRNGAAARPVVQREDRADARARALHRRQVGTAGTSGRAGPVYDPARGVQTAERPLGLGRRGGRRGRGGHRGGRGVGRRARSARGPPSLFRFRDLVARPPPTWRPPSRPSTARC